MKTKQTKPKLESLRIEITPDHDADTSDLGEWTDDLDDGCIVRDLGEYVGDLTEEQREEIPSGGNHYCCFRPYAGGEKWPSKEYKEYGLQDWKRMEGLNYGEWNYVGVKAVAVVQVKQNKNCYRSHTFQSGGLWGIESDAGDYFKEVAQDELADLQEVLATFGVDARGWKKLAKKALEDMKC